MYKNCNQNGYNNNCCPEQVNVFMAEGPTGDTGPQGPTGPQGIQGIPGIPFSSNFGSLQLVTASLTYLLSNDYQPIFYEAIVEGGELGDIIPPAIPGDGNVILRAGHTYFIMFNTQGAFTPSPNRLSYRLLVNGVAIPDLGAVTAPWGVSDGNISHVWTYQANVDTTLRYEIVPENFNSYQLQGAFLNIIQLN